MNAQREIQLSHDLRQIVADHPMSADIEGAIRSGRRARRRIIWLRGASGLGVVALAAGAMAISIHGAPRTTTPPRTSALPSTATLPSGATLPGTAAPAGTPQAETAAYVIKQTEAALANISRYIIRDDVTSPNDDYTLWIDPRTGDTYLREGSGAGAVAAWGSTFLVKNVMHWRTVQVNYGPRTWWDSVIHAAGPIQGPAPSGPTGGPGGTPAQIRQMLASGHFKIIGHREINGHKATGLRGPWADGYREIWVDSATFQPLRIILADFANTRGPLRHYQMVFNESWLPRSTGLVTLVNHPAIPASFTQVPPPQ
jgi:hypothetical protein